MIVNQLAIYTQNDKGNVHNILRILGEHKINILSLFLADTEDFGILRLVTEDNKKAQDVLVPAKEGSFVKRIVSLFKENFSKKSYRGFALIRDIFLIKDNRVASLIQERISKKDSRVFRIK